MATERTLSIIKPDATKRNLTGRIVAKFEEREVMGATDPAAAAAGTIRKEFALSKGENSVHGSDSEASAAREIAFFFSGLELVG
ncbi:MAG: hypothetical protein B7Z04_08940 [Rhodobacterales bacterium 32-66-9]|nr:MAG: hypothetical protein B7Z04_08940 [Rhodobacterales bacterium 32-66-9]